ncbi:MAG: type II toxin-antitoxin system VapC family toxin [Deltaproteobacteria bacterium]|nr:type II toxin-antitoxin system VapC family toxin [Deltaproteobacteria bacterium]
MTALVIDTSAVVALLLGEPDADALKERLLAGSPRLISAFSVLECHVAMSRKIGPAGPELVDRLLSAVSAEVIAFGDAELASARVAFDRFGKARHPAALNLSDCCTYALAKTRGLPVLAKGSDFVATDTRVLD